MRGGTGAREAQRGAARRSAAARGQAARRMAGLSPTTTAHDGPRLRWDKPRASAGSSRARRARAARARTAWRLRRGEERQGSCRRSTRDGSVGRGRRGARSHLAISNTARAHHEQDAGGAEICCRPDRRPGMTQDLAGAAPARGRSPAVDHVGSKKMSYIRKPAPVAPAQRQPGRPG